MSRKPKPTARKLNGILLLDKPSGASSNRVLQQVKRLFRAQKAGHTGTLDPLATGMLPICFGEATKLSQYLIDANKGYETTLVLGVATDTLDADGEAVVEKPVPEGLTREHFERLCCDFKGAQKQIPPMVSAIKVDGKRLYKLAREGINVEREPRDIVIDSLQILDFSPPEVTLRVECSKGTYIRSLVHDLGEAVGCGAHVKTLRRTFVAPFKGMPMFTINTIEQSPNPENLLHPMDIAITHIPATQLLTPHSLTPFQQGRLIPGSDHNMLRRNAGGGVEGVGEIKGLGENLAENGYETGHLSAGELVRVYASDGVTLVGLGTITEVGEIAPKRVFQLN